MASTQSPPLEGAFLVEGPYFNALFVGQDWEVSRSREVVLRKFLGRAHVDYLVKIGEVNRE
tara:strand:+ start:5644 stop:5826 length:183 start_codon:yes stop_codon:yes gene_type:complete